MRAFVTGSTGFLGRRLVAQLLEAGWRVRVSSRSAEKLAALIAAADPEVRHRLEPIYVRLDRDPLAPTFFQDCEVLYHLAGALKGATSALFLHNVVATRRLLAAAQHSELRRVIVVSSLSVYSCSTPPACDEISESYPLETRPELRGGYVMSKVAQEHVCWTNCGAGLPLAVVRPGVIYGPGRSPISDRVGLRVGGHLFVIGPRRRLPYTYVDNCARAIVLAGSAPGIDGLAFNVVDDELPTSGALARRGAQGMKTWVVPAVAIVPLARAYETIRRHSRGQLPVALAPHVARGLYKPVRYSNARAKQELGWHPHVGFEEAMRRTLS